MDLEKPYLALLQPVRAKVLLSLHRTVAPMTGREAARRAGVSQPAALETLGHLVEHGLVHSQAVGSAYLYTLNEKHILVEALDAVFSVRTNLVKRMAASVSRWQVQPLHVSIFGSAARGDGDTKSDIDVLVVRPPFIDGDSDTVGWRGQLDTMIHEIDLWTGNRASLVELSVDELRTLDHERRRILQDIRRDGILVTGTKIDDLLIGKLAPQNETPR
jgi:predicted nucleotidyltransferase